MKKLEKQILLQKINNELAQLKAKINAIIEDDSKDDFLSWLEEDDNGKTPSITPSNNGTTPPKGVVPYHIIKHFKYYNDYVINQTELLLKSRMADINNTDEITMNTAYLIVITRIVLFNNYRKNKLPYFYNQEIFINCQDEVLKIRTNINIDSDWLEASINNYIQRMQYKITRISIN